MKSNTSIYLRNRDVRRFLVIFACLGLGSAALVAQVASAAAEKKDEVLVLNPFVVDATNDSGYVTNESLSGSRFSQNLNDIPSNISVMTAEMIQDLGAFDIQEAMDWSVNALASGVGDSSSSEATGISDVERRNTTINIRGLGVSKSRNFFTWDINSDSFNVERIDTSRGPNALLFGASSLAGLANITTKQANFRDFNRVSLAYDSTGGLGRATLDVNRELIKNKLAVRLNLFTQDVDQWREYGNTKKKGAALAATWKLPAGFTLRFDSEIGDSDIISPKSAIRDQTDNWNHYTITAATTGSNAVKNAANAAAGIAVEASNVLTIDSYRPQDGPINWGGAVRSTGTNAYLQVFPVTNSAGVTQVGVPLVSLAERVTSLTAGFNSNLLIPKWSYGNLRMAGEIVEDHKTYSLFLEKKFSNNFFVEVAYNHQAQTRLWHAEDGNPNIINYDLSPTLPTGYLINGSNVNPNFLKAYITSNPGVREAIDDSDEFRALAVYQYKGPWFNIKVGGNVSYLKSHNEDHRRSLTIVNATEITGNPNYGAGINRPRFKYYLSDPGDGIIKYRDGETYMAGNAKLEYINTSGTLNKAADNELKSIMLFTSGSWGNRGQLQTTVGLRRDIGNQMNYNDVISDPITGVYQSSGLSDTNDSDVSSPSYGAVYHVTDWLSVYGNYSKSFQFGAKNLTFDNKLIPPPIGDSLEYGIRFKIGNKISGAINYYDSLEANHVVQDNGMILAAQSIYDLLGLGSVGRPVDTNIQTSTGYEFSMTGNPTRSWTITANVGLPHVTTTDTFQYAYDDWYAKNSPAWKAIPNSDPNYTTIQGNLATLEFRRTLKSQQDGFGALKLIKLTGSLLTKYTFLDGSLKGLSVGAGAKYRGKNNVSREVDTSVTPSTYVDTFVDGYFEYTLFGRYGFKWKNLKWNISLNINNPFNQLNFRYTNLTNGGLDGQTYRISTPRTARLALDVAF